MGSLERSATRSSAIFMMSSVRRAGHQPVPYLPAGRVFVGVLPYMVVPP